MPTTTSLFQKLETWRYGSLFRRVTRNDTGKSIEELWTLVQSMDERCRDLERKLEAQTKLLNYGMIAGACKDSIVRVNSTANTPITTVAAQAITGAGITFTPDYDVRVAIHTIFDVLMLVVAPSVFFGLIYVDGVQQVPQIGASMVGVAAVAGVRATCAQNVVVTLTGKTAHTIQLYGAVNAVGGTYQVTAPNSGFLYHAVPIPPF